MSNLVNLFTEFKVYSLIPFLTLMLSQLFPNASHVFRTPFKVVREGRIFKKIRPLSPSFEHYPKYIF